MYNEKDIISKWNSEMYDCEETETYDVEFALSVIGAETTAVNKVLLLLSSHYSRRRVITINK